MPAKIDKLKFVGHFVLAAFFLAVSAGVTSAQNPAPSTDTLKKTNTRPVVEAAPVIKSEPFDGALVEKMSGQCVTLETEPGTIVI